MGWGGVFDGNGDFRAGVKEWANVKILTSAHLGLSLQVHELLQHLVRNGDNLGIGLVTSLRNDHLD